jgi:hypothetical protein
LAKGGVDTAELIRSVRNVRLATSDAIIPISPADIQVNLSALHEHNVLQVMDDEYESVRVLYICMNVG